MPRKSGEFIEWLCDKQWSEGILPGERWACIVCLRVNHTRRQINDELLSASNADKESDLHDHASKRSLLRSLRKPFQSGFASLPQQRIYMIDSVGSAIFYNFPK